MKALHSVALSALVAVATLAATAVAGVGQGGTAGTSGAAEAAAEKIEAKVPQELRWEPSWREPADCGPVALLVLMRLQNKPTTMDDIRSVIHLDRERGCSLQDLQAAADQLGMPAESRFVKPDELKSLPFPFIFHGVSSVEKGLGHFDVILAYDSEKNKFATLNPALTTVIWFPEAVMLRSYSGYVLLPARSLAQKGEALAGYGLLFAGVTILSVWWHLTVRRRRKAAIHP